jgi:uncharacterized protein (DUF362 family)
MRKYFSRREFLAHLAIGTSSLTIGQLLSGCSPFQSTGIPTTTSVGAHNPNSTLTIPQNNQPNSPEVIDQQSTFSQTESVEPVLQSTVEETDFLPHLVVARGDDPTSLVQQSLAALGGIERYVKPGNKVIIKPNICVAYHSYEFAATTNPWVVGEITRLCVAAGASKVTVMDSPFGGTPQQAYARSGIEEQVRSAGGEMMVMSDFKFTPVELHQALDLQSIEVYDDILTTDVMINVPIAKHHSLARLTLGMKNLMGVIRNRPAIHSNIGQRLADLTNFIRPTLTIIDAVRMLMANGPTGGNINDVKKANTIIASEDVVAADSYAATLFGLRPDDLSYIQAGAMIGLGRNDLENLKIEEIVVEV